MIKIFLNNFIKYKFLSKIYIDNINIIIYLFNKFFLIIKNLNIINGFFFKKIINISYLINKFKYVYQKFYKFEKFSIYYQKKFTNLKKDNYYYF